MKTKLKRVSKSTLAVILAIMMVFSSMLVGTISVSAASYDLYSSSTQTGSSGTKLGTFSSSDGSTYTLTYTATATETLYLYIYDGGSSWMNQNADISLGKSVTLYKYGTAQSGHVQKLAVTSGKTYEFTWKPGSSNGTFTANEGSSGGDTSQKYYVRGYGSGLSWDSSSAKEMTKSDDGTYYYYEVTTPSDTVNFKIAKSATGWDYGYSSTAVDGSPISIGVNDNTNFSIASQSSNYYIIFYPGDSIKVQASTTRPGSVTTHTATVSVADGAPDGANAYVSSYTDKDGNTQSGTSSTTSATFKDGTDVTFTATDVSGYTISWSGATGNASEDGTTYTVSGATDDITVTATYAKKTYTVTAGECINGTVTVDGGSTATVEYGETVNLVATPTPATGYQFKEWNTVPGITYADSKNASTTATVTGNAEVTATFEEKPAETKYYIIGEAVGNWQTSVELETVSGTTYSHTFNSSSDFATSKEFLVSSSTSTDNNVKASGTSGNGVTINTSNNNLTVSLQDNYTYPITLTYDSDTKKLSGSATPVATTTTYHVVYGSGENSIEMTETATGSGIFVSSNTIGSNYYFTVRKTVGSTKTYARSTGSPQSISSESSNTSVNSWGTTYLNNTNVYSNGCGKLEYVYYDANQDVVYLKSSKDTTTSSWYLTGYLNKNSIGTAQEEFKFTQSATNTNEFTLTYTFTKNENNSQYVTIYDKDNSKAYHPATHESGSGVKADTSINRGPTEDPKWKVDATTGTTVTFTWDALNYVLSWEIMAGNSVIYAKNGSFNKDGKSGLQYGTTTILDSNASTAFTPSSTDSDHGYSTYSIEAGTYVTIRSTIPASYYNSGNGFYVAGFVVNGETVSITNEQKDTNGNGIFDGYYVVGEESKIEITPVYFNRAIEANGDYVYFTLDASEVPDGWGNTTSVYTYYYYDDNGTTKQYEPDGQWPGQPLLKTNTGTYWTKISKYYYDNTGAKTETAFSGLVVNNYGPDYVHNTLGTSPKQTYDYNTPVVAVANGYDTISFSTKYRSTIYNHDKINPAENTFAAQGTFSTSIYETGTGNGWDVLRNYTGDSKVDVLGNKVTDDNLLPIYIVSVGNINTKGRTDIPAVGQWSTMWYVYAENSDGSFTPVTYGTPSQFINEGTEQYQAMNSDTYKGRTTYVTYEQENNLESSADRIDGQWYYMKSTEIEVTLYAQAQYLAADGKTWVTDVNGIAGTALVEGNAPDERGASSATFKGVDNEANITATSKDGYVFDGWYLVDTKSGTDTSKFTYTKLENISSSDTIPVTNSMLIVARFTPIGSGSLALTHTNKPGSGLGYYSISAQVKDKYGNNVGELLTGSTVTIPTIQADYSVVITLTTRMAGINTFDGWYMLSDGIYYPFGGEDAPVINNNIATCTFTLNADQIFYDKTQLVTSLTYYSNIITVDGTAVLNYQYLDRDNKVKTYTTSVKLSPEYLEAHGYSLDNNDGKALIVANAPYIEDLHKDVKWNIVAANLQYNKTTVTLKAEYIEKTYTVIINDGDFSDTKSGIKYNTLITDSRKITDKNPLGLSICAEGENFSYWKVTNAKGEEVARTYEKYFNLRIVDDYTLTAVYGVEGVNEAKLGKPVYTREQYTEGNTQYDYLYADFVVSYTTTDGTLIRDNPSRFKTGIILEYDTNYKVSGPKEDFSSVKYVDRASLDDVIKLENGKNIISDSGSGKQIAYNYVIEDNTKYNNMNRVSYYLKFNNKVTSYRNYVMKAYYYVVDTKTGETYFSEEVYFNLYDIATSNPDVKQ